MASSLRIPHRALPSTPDVRGGVGRLLLALVISCALPVSAGAQAVIPADEPTPASPLDQLLEQRDALELTAEQVGRLERIRERLAVTNEPLVTRMMSLRDQWQQERRTRRAGEVQDTARIERIRTAAARVRIRIQDNNQTAMRTVNRLLTPAQRQQLRSIVQERRQQNPGRRRGGSNASDDR